MIREDMSDYMYLTIPTKYGCVYEKLLIKLSDLGVDMIKDCTSTCRGTNKLVVNCWNMFQGACASYMLGYEKQADLIIDYINKSLALGCTENGGGGDDPEPPVYENIMYYGHTDIAPQTFEKMSIEEIFAIEDTTAKAIRGTNANQFTINQEKKIHYLLIPDETMTLVKAEYGTVLITNLWDGTKGAYKTVNPGGIYNTIHYKVFFLYSPQVFPDDIRITCKNIQQ